MTQQNRVDPWGGLNAVSARGTLMGNRGILHDEEGKIVRQWKSALWVTCLLEFRDRKSPGMFRPGRYSKLFFLDEATALAAGHRPCGECQRSRFLQFKQAWMAANVSSDDADQFSLQALDRQLHEERVQRGAPKGKRTYTPSSEPLPFGTMVVCADKAWLISRDGSLLPWSFEGYGTPVMPSNLSASELRVLTPPSVVRMFEAGFEPKVHSSAANCQHHGRSRVRTTSSARN